MFSDNNIEYLQTRLSGYSKAFGEYFVFRLTKILYSMRREFGITFENETFESIPFSVESLEVAPAIKRLP